MAAFSNATFSVDQEWAACFSKLLTEAALRATNLFSEVSGALTDKSWGIKNTSDNGIDIIAKPKYGTYAAQGGWYGDEVNPNGIVARDL